MMSVATTATTLSTLTRPAPVPPAVRRGAWQLMAGQAQSLRARSCSVLKVRQGRLWITRDADQHRASEDLVLGPGESLALARGDRIVMEPWDGFGATYTWDAA
jgi:hypothetical protein